MTAAVLLSVALAGQCGPRGCPAPGFGPSLAPGLAPLTLSAPTVVAQPVRPAQVEGRDYYVVKRYRVEHKGVVLTVEGYFRPDTGQVVWDQDRPFNRDSLSAALAHAREVPAKATAKADPRPVGDAGRRPASEPGPPPGRDQEVGQVGSIKNFGLAPERMTHQRDAYHAPSAEARRRDSSMPWPRRFTTLIMRLRWSRLAGVVQRNRNPSNLSTDCRGLFRTPPHSG